MNCSPGYKLLAITLLVFVAFGCASRDRSGLGPGEKPPAFELIDLNKETRTLEQFAGKVVLLNFWATWCVPCVAEMPALQRLYTKYQSQGLEIVAIGVDDEAHLLQKFKDQHNLTFPILVDTQGSVKSKYALRGVPETFLIGRDGRLVLLRDPEDDIERVRIVGPREWDSFASVKRIEELLGKK